MFAKFQFFLFKKTSLQAGCRHDRNNSQISQDCDNRMKIWKFAFWIRIPMAENVGFCKKKKNNIYPFSRKLWGRWIGLGNFLRRVFILILTFKIQLWWNRFIRKRLTFWNTGHYFICVSPTSLSTSFLQKLRENACFH